MRRSPGDQPPSSQLSAMNGRSGSWTRRAARTMSSASRLEAARPRSSRREAEPEMHEMGMGIDEAGDDGRVRKLERARRTIPGARRRHGFASDGRNPLAVEEDRIGRAVAIPGEDPGLRMSTDARSRPEARRDPVGECCGRTESTGSCVSIVEGGGRGQRDLGPPWPRRSGFAARSASACAPWRAGCRSPRGLTSFTLRGECPARKPSAPPPAATAAPEARMHPDPEIQRLRARSRQARQGHHAK